MDRIEKHTLDILLGLRWNLGLVDRNLIIGIDVLRGEPDLVIDVILLKLLFEGFHALALDLFLLFLVAHDLAHLTLKLLDPM